MYNRTLSPSRGITMAEPCSEWMAQRLRMSGKFVSKTVSTTPQMRSMVTRSSSATEVSYGGWSMERERRTCLFAFHLNSEVLANPRVSTYFRTPRSAFHSCSVQRGETRPLTVSPNDKPRIHDLGRRLFISGVESFQVHLVPGQFIVSVHIDVSEHRSGVP